MPKYTTSQSAERSGSDSDYESDGGSHYRYKRVLGTGSVDRARLFVSPSGRSRVILKPKNQAVARDDLAEYKRFFFGLFYPHEDVSLFRVDAGENSDYRLVVPLAPGKPYSKFQPSNPTKQIELCLSAVEALMVCHQAGYCIIDLKEDNIYYDVLSHKSYLIDGAFLTEQGKWLPIICEDEKAVRRSQRRSQHVAPECFSTSEQVAAETMDIYALGDMLQRLCKENDRLVNLLEHYCKGTAPESRASLFVLHTMFLQMLTQNHQVSDQSNSLLFKGSVFEMQYNQFWNNYVVFWHKKIREHIDNQSGSQSVLPLIQRYCDAANILKKLVMVSQGLFQDKVAIQDYMKDICEQALKDLKDYQVLLNKDSNNTCASVQF